MSAPKDAVTVRMYNVGFGDSFLVLIPDGDRRPRRVLVDCGVHFLGSGPKKISEVAQQIVEDVRDEDGIPRIDVVIVSHRHQDHVSGFESPVWNEVEVSEVWLPWTEDPEDPEARVIRERQSKLALQLSLAAAGNSRVELFARNALKNEKAMWTLHQGFSGEPRRRFLPPKERAKASFAVRCLPRVRVHVMGPSRDPKVIRDMDPPLGRSYLRMHEGGPRDMAPLQPFEERWVFTPETFGALAPHLSLRPDDAKDLKRSAEENSLAVAVALEKAVNGTSLLLMLQVGQAHLLFPGDAQWGTWRVALDDPEWRELLSRTTFHKIGHHGSHNATPREFVEEVLGEGFFAMASTRLMDNWPDIPKAELLKALREKSPYVVRSDEKSRGEAKVFRRGPSNLYVDVQVPI